MTELQKAVLKTLAYSDLFDYPLTTLEVWKYLIIADRDRVRDREELEKELNKLVEDKKIEKDGEFYFLKEEKEIVELRKQKERGTEEKLKIAQDTADKLGLIPFIKMIGVTGALSMNNAKENDDIDLMVVAAKNSLWLTRFLILMLCPFLGIKRRKRTEKKAKNKICFNLFLEENHLKIQSESLFLAHEIVQVKPVSDRGGIYDKFMQENKWAGRYLPNAIQNSNFQTPNSKQIPIFKKCRSISQYLNILISFLDKIAYCLQYQYMKPKITCEKISRYQTFFHPNNLQNKIEEEFKRKITLLGIDKK